MRKRCDIAVLAFIAAAMLSGCGDESEEIGRRSEPQSSPISGVPNVDVEPMNELTWGPLVASAAVEVVVADTELTPEVDGERKWRAVGRVFWRNTGEEGWVETPQLSVERSAISALAVREREVLVAVAECPSDFAQDATQPCGSAQLQTLDLESREWSRRADLPGGDNESLVGLWGTASGWIAATQRLGETAMGWYLSNDAMTWATVAEDVSPTLDEITVSGGMCVLETGDIIWWFPTVDGAVDPATRLPQSWDQVRGTTIKRWNPTSGEFALAEATDWDFGFACTSKVVVGTQRRVDGPGVTSASRVNLDDFTAVEPRMKVSEAPVMATGVRSGSNAVLVLVGSVGTSTSAVACSDIECETMVQALVQQSAKVQILGRVWDGLLLATEHGLEVNEMTPIR